MSGKLFDEKIFKKLSLAKYAMAKKRATLRSPRKAEMPVSRNGQKEGHTEAPRRKERLKNFSLAEAQNSRRKT